MRAAMLVPATEIISLRGTAIEGRWAWSALGWIDPGYDLTVDRRSNPSRPTRSRSGNSGVVDGRRKVVIAATRGSCERAFIRGHTERSNGVFRCGILIANGVATG